MQCCQLNAGSTIQCGTPRLRVLRLHKYLPSHTYKGTRAQQDGKYTYGVTGVVTFVEEQYSVKTETSYGNGIEPYQNINYNTDTTLSKHGANIKLSPKMC